MAAVAGTERRPTAQHRDLVAIDQDRIGHKAENAQHVRHPGPDQVEDGSLAAERAAKRQHIHWGR
jgi:hypothetical protein